MVQLARAIVECVFGEEQSEGTGQNRAYTGVEPNRRGIDTSGRELKHLCELDW